jgi:uncharacterized HAD superfamily protein
MPPRYVAEMLCDWVGAGKAYNKGNWTIDTFKEWYESNKDKMALHTLTRMYIELVMRNVKSEKEIYSHWAKPNVIASDYALVEMQG